MQSAKKKTLKVKTKIDPQSIEELLLDERDGVEGGGMAANFACPYVVKPPKDNRSTDT